VFGRQWLNPKRAEEMECRDQLAAMINDPQSRKPDADFAEVLLKSRCLLEKIVMDMPRPFLLQAADRVCQELQAMSASASVHQLPAKTHRKIDVLPAVVDVETLTDSGDQSVDDDDGDCDGDDDDTKTSVSASASHISGSKPTKISSVDDMWRPSTVWKMGAGKGGKIPWSAVEEEQVYLGVLAHGVGNWAPIRANFVPHRTNVDIKDKWRTMKRQQGRLQILADKLGPLPATCLY